MFSRFALTPSSLPPSFQKLALRATGAGRGRSLALISDSTAQNNPAAFDMARQLAEDGWKVTFLDLAPPSQKTAPPAQQVFAYERLAGLYRETNWYVPLQALGVYHWLREKKFDFVLWQHGFGTGYYAGMARKLGLAFQDTAFVIHACEPFALRLEQAMKFPSGYTDMETDFLERETMAMADAVLCTTMDTADWLVAAGWAFPRNVAALDDGKDASAWGAWLDKITPSHHGKTATEPVSISVCMAIYNRPVLLREALNSLTGQSLAAFELIVIDDGSTDKKVEELRQEFAPLFKSRGWRWETRPNAGPSAARNYAASLAKSTHLLFMDDDNIAYPDELERFSAAAARGCDILSCVIGLHPDSDMSFPPTAHMPERSGGATRPVGWPPLGNALGLAPFINKFGETNSLFRREVFEALGGFQGDRDMMFEDFDVFIRASIAGYRIDVVPEVLLLYRRHKASRSMGPTIFRSHIDTLKPIAALLPPALRPLLLTLRHEWYERHCQRRDGSKDEASKH
ncbi:MAG: glycosyltransferase [Alphaproteobacteria bacterium]|nr:glycosyltransferase [Alphaproteobacteria bacterium]